MKNNFSSSPKYIRAILTENAKNIANIKYENDFLTIANITRILIARFIMKIIIKLIKAIWVVCKNFIFRSIGSILKIKLKNNKENILIDSIVVQPIAKRTAFFILLVFTNFFNAKNFAISVTDIVKNTIAIDGNIFVTKKSLNIDSTILKGSWIRSTAKNVKYPNRRYFIFGFSTLIKIYVIRRAKTISGM